MNKVFKLETAFWSSELNRVIDSGTRNVTDINEIEIIEKYLSDHPDSGHEYRFKSEEEIEIIEERLEEEEEFNEDIPVKKTRKRRKKRKTKPKSSRSPKEIIVEEKDVKEIEDKSDDMMKQLSVL